MRRESNARPGPSPLAAAGRRAEREAEAAGRAAPPLRSRVGGWPIAAALAVIALILYIVRYALLPFVFAAAIAFVVDPLVAELRRRLRLPRWAVAVLLCVVFYGLVGVPAYWMAGAAIGELSNLVSQGPTLLHNLIQQAVGPGGVHAFGITVTADSAMAALGRVGKELLGPPTLLPLATTGLYALLAGLLTMLMLPYFMISGPSLARGAIRLLPPERRPPVEALLPKIVPVLRRYLLSIFLVVLYTSTVGYLGFALAFNLPHALLLAIIVGVLELIPLLGPIASATLLGLTAMQEGDLWRAASLAAFAIALRVSIDNVVGPLVLGRAARVHPVVIMFAFVCGGMLFGVVGLVLAVPLVTCLKIALGHYYAEPIRPEERA